MPAHRIIRTYTCAYCGTVFERARKIYQERAACSRACISHLSRRHPTDPADIRYDGDTCHVPLYRRDGSICGYTAIDTADVAFVSQWRWRLGTGGYAKRGERTNGSFHDIRLHRELLGMIRGDGMDGDHIDRDRLNNRRGNLRVVTEQGNGQNKSSFIGSTSSYRGVSWHSRDRKWRATVKTAERIHNLGSFASEVEAARVAREARLRLLPYAVD